MTGKYRLTVSFGFGLAIGLGLFKLGQVFVSLAVAVSVGVESRVLFPDVRSQITRLTTPIAANEAFEWLFLRMDSALNRLVNRYMVQM